MMRRTTRLSYLAGGVIGLNLLTFAGVPAYGQQPTLKDVLDGKHFPTTLEAKELTAQYRVLGINENDGMTARQRRQMGMEEQATAIQSYYTSGESITIGETTYLIAYRREKDKLKLEDDRITQQLINDYGFEVFQEKKVPEGPMEPVETLNLSLLNLSTIGNIERVRGFEPKKEVMSAEQYQLTRGNRESASNLRQLALALLNQAISNDEFPAMIPATSMAQIEKGIKDNDADEKTPVFVVLRPFVQSVEVYRHPITKELYRPNPSLTGKSIGIVESLSTTVMFYEGSVGADGKRGVVFVNGQVKRVKEADWPALAKQSGVVKGSKKPVARSENPRWVVPGPKAGDNIYIQPHERVIAVG